MKITVSPFEKRALAIATSIAVIFGAYFLWRYFLLIVLAAVVAYLFSPLYKYLLRKTKRQSVATTLTLLSTIFVVIIPFTIVLLITVYQATQLVGRIDSIAVGELQGQFINTFNNLMERLNISYVLTPEIIQTTVINAVKAIGGSIVSGLSSFLGNFVSFFTTAVIYIFVFMALLTNMSKLEILVKKLNPLGEQIGELYLNRVGAMTKAVVKGQFIIAFLQGLLGATFLYIAGFEGLFFFFLVLLTVLSVIPLGGGIVTIPIGIGLILTGSIWQGVFILATHFLVITNIDNVLRPLLVPKQARLNPALMLLSVFSGIGLFGFLGIIVGPVIMILIVTTIQVFLEVYRDMDVIDRTPIKPRKKLLKKST